MSETEATETVNTAVQNAESGNPVYDPAAILAKLKNSPPENYVTAEASFGFKGKKVRDADGNVLEEVKAPPALKLKVPFITMHGLVEAIQVPKTLDFILDTLNDAIKSQVREQIDDKFKPLKTQEDLDISKLHLDYIASIPKSARGGGIAEEVWEGFAKDYIAVQVASGKDAIKAGNAAKLLEGKLNAVRTNKKVLEFLVNQLDFWAVETSNLDEFEPCYTFLKDKAAAYLSVSDEALLANL